MNWSAASPLAALGYIAFLLLICGISEAIKENRKRRSRAQLARLNSPYFRGMHSPYYRVGNDSGLGG